MRTTVVTLLVSLICCIESAKSIGREVNQGGRLEVDKPGGQTVFMIGDSTMSACRTMAMNKVTAGWGTPFASFFFIPVDNQAIAGYSARMFAREGKFQAVVDRAKTGDYAIIELGWNDALIGDDPGGRRPCPPVEGDYKTTCQMTFNGVNETVLTFTAYLVNVAQAFKQVGVNVVISTLTTWNPYKDGPSFQEQRSNFVDFARLAAQIANVAFVDHHGEMTNDFRTQGASQVYDYYLHPPAFQDNIHLTPKGARAAAQSFVTAMIASNSTSLSNFVLSSPKAFEEIDCSKPHRRRKSRL